ncbi:MAG TPA: peptidylprolyl isomerase [Tepidisphaeraceae bacterium]|nr:peptidylprolyl isomerase [Tepidisphaeraceae bacterium]
MQIAKNTVAKIDYTLTNPQGQVLDTSKGREPLAYLHGVGGIIPGLETALEGKSSGDQISVTIPPEKAYGHRNEELVQEIPRRMFQGVDNIQPGMQFQAQSQQGMRVVTVVGLTGDNVRVDANHPLAGVTLNFDVKVVEVREATPEELSHGHVHGPGGHHH